MKMAETITMSDAERTWSSEGNQWSLEPDFDPRSVLAHATVRSERSFDSYRQREAWVTHPAQEDAQQEAQAKKPADATEHVLLEN